MNRNLSVWLASAALVTSLGLMADNVQADDAAAVSVTKNRQQFRDERPDYSRGWVIVAKESYWPLCYEALEMLDESNKLIGKGKPDELADSLAKCGAWLQMASSAAMSPESSAMDETIELCKDAAEELRSGKSKWDDKKLKQLIVLANLSIARSHATRADQADLDENPTRRFNKGKAAAGIKSKDTTEAAAGAEIANQKRLVAQYRYETVEALRHLEVAQAYLEAAKEAGNLKVDAALLKTLPELPKQASGSDMTNFVEIEIRSRVEKMQASVDAESQKLLTEFDSVLDDN